MSRLHDTELADTVAWAALASMRAVQVDRSSARWQRVRAALCEHHGLGKHFSLDEHADLVWSAISNATGPDRTTLDGSSAVGAEGGAV